MPGDSGRDSYSRFDESYSSYYSESEEDLNEPNANSNKHLYTAVKSNHNEQVNILLNNPEIEFNKKKKKCESPLHLATCEEHIECIT